MLEAKWLKVNQKWRIQSERFGYFTIYLVLYDYQVLSMWFILDILSQLALGLAWHGYVPLYCLSSRKCHNTFSKLTNNILFSWNMCLCCLVQINYSWFLILSSNADTFSLVLIHSSYCEDQAVVWHGALSRGWRLWPVSK